jgi:Protein of unknown function (DUF2442)
MTKKARVLTTDAEIDAAIALAKLREPYRPKAVAAEYRAKDDVIAIELASGVELVIPRKLLQGLENASPEQLAKVEICGPGSSLHWKALDEAKARAARANGRKGGRPRKRSAA